MAISKKTVKVFRGIWGGFLTIILLPIMGVFSIVSWIGARGLELWDFIVDFWKSVSDPGYCRVGMCAAMVRDRYVGMAARSWELGDKQGAVELWRKAARLYSNHAMLRLAQCFEAGEGVEQSLSKAYEFYRLADIYHHDQAEKECERLKQYAMGRRQRAEFLDKIWQKK